jgi:hypothetical protein
MQPQTGHPSAAGICGRFSVCVTWSFLRPGAAIASASRAAAVNDRGRDRKEAPTASLMAGSTVHNSAIKPARRIEIQNIFQKKIVLPSVSNATLFFECFAGRKITSPTASVDLESGITQTVR